MNEILAPIYYVIAQDPAFNLATSRYKKTATPTTTPKATAENDADSTTTAVKEEEEEKEKKNAEDEVTQETLDRWAEADTFNCFANIMVEVGISGVLIFSCCWCLIRVVLC